jgi:hypothetical protein
MNKPVVIAMLCICSMLSTVLPQASFGQHEPYYHGLRRNFSNNTDNTEMASTGQSGTGANIDVIYHKAFWRINPDSTTKYIRGFVQTNFKTIVANVSSISLDMNAVLAIDSVRFRGARLAAGNISRTGNIVTITLGTTLANNFIDSLWIFYRGTPPAASGAAEGYQVATETISGQRYIYTLSESYEDRDWWPCKADMQDKVDSMDIIVSVPWSGADTFWVATNGKLVDSTISAGSRIFTFKTRYPIATYLVSVAVARYNRFYRPPVNVGGINVPVVYNIIRGKTAANITSILNAMDAQSLVLSEFSKKFGDYPFKREKHGYYEGLGGAGGMEHQTFSAMASGALTSASTLAHELIHQWFGDKATFATWADLWLAEGFARYGEALAGELVPATGLNPVTEMSSAKTNARSIPNTPARLTAFGTSNVIWSNNNIRAIYDRGAMIISMLRRVSGDAKFFLACRNYLDSAKGSGYKAANTDSLLNNFNRVLNYDLKPFFDNWVTGVGHPTTVVNWNNFAPNRLAVSIASQTRTAGATASYFRNVIPIRVQGALASQDTMIVFMDIDGNNLAYAGEGIGVNIPGNQLTYTLSFTPVTVTFDPYNWTMSAGSTVKVTTLDLRILDFNVRRLDGHNEATVILDDNSINTPVILERSKTGDTFTELGTMPELTGMGSGKTYRLNDYTPFIGDTYYRAKYKNAAGSWLYSRIIKLSSTVKGGFSILSNPVTNGRLILRNANFTAGKTYQLRIFDAAGKRMLTATIQDAVTQIDVSRMSRGTYITRITGSNGEEELIRFVVE